ncbi:MAG: hypothetical protein NVS4B8_25080 [Herpetosiphon sp.]
MKIALYNRWLQTRGGGERHSLALAATLAQRHDITVLVHEATDLTALGDFLQLDLSPLGQATVPDSPGGRAIGAAAAEFDGFIGASHTDVVLPRARRRNAMLVYFPRPLEEDPDAPFLLQGWYEAEHGPAGVFRWSDSRASIEVAPLATTRRIELGVARPQGVAKVSVRCREREWTYSVGPQTRWIRVVIPPLAERIIVSTAPFHPSDDKRELGLTLVGMREGRRRWWWQEHTTINVDQLPDKTLIKNTAIDGYSLLLANSHFTQEWVQRRWNRASEVLYPPIVEMVGTPLRERVILSVGRFFAGGHAKQHGTLIEAFRRFSADPAFGDWRLVLVGGLDAERSEDVAYFKSMEQQAEGLAVELYPNLEQPELEHWYGVARLYWHAAGFGVDQEREPQAVEHFGIAVAQALAAGAVPVVYRAGGPAEIVRPGKDGEHWETIDQLVAHSQRVAGDSLLHATMAGQARGRARFFSERAFEQRVWTLFGDW